MTAICFDVGCFVTFMGLKEVIVGLTIRLTGPGLEAGETGGDTSGERLAGATINVDKGTGFI